MLTLNNTLVYNEGTARDALATIGLDKFDIEYLKDLFSKDAREDAEYFEGQSVFYENRAGDYENQICDLKKLLDSTYRMLATKATKEEIAEFMKQSVKEL